MKPSAKFFMLVVLTAVPGFGATVTIEELWMRTPAGGDPVPGRAAPVVFRELTGTVGGLPVMLPPVINNVGDVVFRARSASQSDNNVQNAIGIYAKQPSLPMIRLADTTCDGGNACTAVLVTPSTPVPGRPAGTVFTGFKAPLVNDVGDVVFYATFGGVSGSGLPSGSGFYSTTVTGGALVMLADTFTTVPGHGASVFNTFNFVITQMLTVALNNNGEVVYWGQFLISPSATQRNGIFGTTVAGGAGTLLCDSTQNPAFTPVGMISAFGSFNEVRPTLAISNNTPGIVAFKGNLGAPSPSPLGGVFAVSVTGGPIQAVATGFQPAPGRTQTFGTSFGPSDDTVDINDSGQVVFQNNFFPSFPTEFGHYAGSAAGGPHTRIIDTFGCSFGPCLLIPGETVPPAEYSGASFPNVNEAGQVGVFSRVINTPVPNQQGIFATDTDGSPISVVANLLTPPPGLAVPVAGFPNFSNGGFTTESAAINDDGHMAFGAGGLLNISTSFVGLYFYDACVAELSRVSDSTVGLATLGLNFTSGQQNRFDAWQLESRSGHLKSLGNNNDLAFAVAFSNFDSGMFIAHISTGGGGDVAIACPPDVSGECPADGGVASGGTATASGCGTITVSSSDVLIPGCGGTVSISRTWTATNGSTAATCVQTLSEVDVTPPVLSGAPSDAAVQCNGLPPAAVVTALDACEGSVPVTLTETQVPGSCPGTYVLTRTWTATDGCGNSASASQDVAVMDTLDPVLVGVPTDVSVECDAVPAPATVTASDTCSTSVPVTFAETQANGSCTDEYTLTRGWTAVDECLNDVTALQIVTVDDTTAPTIACPAHTTLECPADSGVGANGSASGADNCAAPAVSSADAMLFGCGATFTVTRTWTATDNCGNASSCDQFVAVVDTTAPVLAGVPADASAECDAVPAAATVTAADGCDPDVAVSFAEARADGSCLSNYALSRSWSAADDCGNNATASQSVTVADTTPPTVSCPPSTTLECPGDSSVAANGSASGADNCGGAAVGSSDVTTPACGTTGSTVRTWTATDDCGLTSSCQQSVTVVDTTPPTISVTTTAIVVTDTNCSGTECVELPTGTATDSCDNDVAVQHNAPTCGPGDDSEPDDGDDDCGYHCHRHGHHCGDDDDDDDPPSGTCDGFCFPVGTTTVTYSAMDDCGNTTATDQTVTVRHGSNIAVRVDRYTVYHGHHPHTDKDPLAGVTVCAYDRSYDGCARTTCGGTSHPHYACILDECEPEGCCVTGSNGRCTINLSPDDYLVLASDPTEEVLPDPLATTVNDLDCGETKTVHLKQIVDVHGKKRPCKVWRFTGSELLVVEPEFIVWDEEVQFYPFVLETEGDWTVTATVAPPDGFVADFPELSAEVVDTLSAVQFTITELGSDLIPTQTEFVIGHKGQVQTLRSEVDIRLTPDYANRRGFRVDKLRRDGLIVEPVEQRRAHRAEKGTLRSGQR